MKGSFPKSAMSVEILYTQRLAGLSGGRCGGPVILHCSRTDRPRKQEIPEWPLAAQAYMHSSDCRAGGRETQK